MLAIVLRILATFLMIAVGFIARRKNRITDDTTGQLSYVLTRFFYPALVFTSMTHNFDLAGLGEFWMLPVGGFSIMAMGFVIGLIIEKFIHRPKVGLENAFLFQCTMNNYSFLPLPLALMLWGEEGVAGVIFASLGAELAVWTLGVFAISGRKINKSSLKNLLSPPLLTITFSLLWIVLRDVLPDPLISTLSRPFFANPFGAVRDALQMLGSATIPIAMVMAGSRMAGLKANHLVSMEKNIVATLRLLLVPGLVWGLLVVLPVPSEVQRTLLLISTMPSAVASVIFSELYREDAEFAAACILLTHILCIFTIPVWMLLV